MAAYSSAPANGLATNVNSILINGLQPQQASSPAKNSLLSAAILRSPSRNKHGSASALQVHTKAYGLSLDDRCCLALSQH